MSWIFGLLARRIGVARRRRLVRCHPPALHRIERPDFYLAAGGLPETCLAAPDADEGWLVAGLGIERHDDASSFLSGEAWGRRLARRDADLDDVHGHYVVVRWSRRLLRCRTDPLGLRTLYLRRTDEGVYLSTRLDWLAAAAGPLEIDFEALGTHWLAANQYAHRSLVRRVVRLGPGATAGCTAGGVSAGNDPWTPAPGAPGPSKPDLAATLAPFLAPRLPEGVRLSLGLSGGLDSRVLLALLGHRGRPFDAHVFGAAAHPDVRVATRIAEGEGIRCRRLGEGLPPADELVARLSEHAAATHATTPASASARLGDYAALRDAGLVAVDGFFGEIARRQYYRRLVAQGPEAFLAMRDEALVAAFHVPRADVFEEGAMRLMRYGMRDDLNHVLAWYRSTGPIALADFVDLLSVRYRLSNFAGYEQARLDGHALAYMPFAQRPFIEEALRLPVGRRTGGRALRRLLRRHGRSLRRYPLVKGGATYPYVLPSAAAWAWTNLKARMGATYRDREAVDFLRRLEPLVQDVAHSSGVRDFWAYDHGRVVAAVEGFYAGDDALAPYVDWWLSFEMWRRSIM